MHSKESRKLYLKETGHFKVNTNLPKEPLFKNKKDAIVFSFSVISMFFAILCGGCLIIAMLFDVNSLLFIGASVGAFGISGVFITSQSFIKFKKSIFFICSVIGIIGAALIWLSSPKLTYNEPTAKEVIIDNPGVLSESYYINSSKPSFEQKAPNTFSRGQTATITHRGKPFYSYDISVYYSTSKSTAKGLESKTADKNGVVSWSFKISNNTKPGVYNVIIEGGEETKELLLTVE